MSASKLHSLNGPMHRPPIGVLCCILTASVCTSCIEKFTPEYASVDKVLVIDGSVVAGDTLQTVTVSYATEVVDPEFVPLAGCRVSVIDSLGNEFVFDPSANEGIYEKYINSAFLSPGTWLQLNVRTPDFKKYRSEWNRIPETTRIDSLYFVEEQDRKVTESFESGLQLYVDLKGTENDAKTYMWTVEETWEINTVYNISGVFRQASAEAYSYILSDSITQCWKTKTINEIFTDDTESLLVNEKKKIPLSFVNHKNSKLNTVYSVSVKQYTLNKEAYIYLSKVGDLSSEKSLLYEKQPSQLNSNIHNTTDETEEVYGYFWTSNYVSKRAFFDGPLTTAHYDCSLRNCRPVDRCVVENLLRGYDIDFFLVDLGGGEWGIPYNQECINCTAYGGVNVKPDFWIY